MAAQLALEYLGFLKFMTRANHELHKWFGGPPNHDPARVAFLASREWDGMADNERKPFIQPGKESGASSNPYIHYLLTNRYTSDEARGKDGHIFDPKNAKLNAQKWKSLSVEQRNKFSSTSASDHGIDHVIEKRNKLHELYDPRKLCQLEFILRTKPRWPSNSRMWFYRNECHSLASEQAKKRWTDLDAEERDVYERCALIDRKRFEFEKKAWITRILTIDFDKDDFTLSDFDISDVEDRFESLGSIVEISRELPSLVALRRPRNAFSLFIEAYRYQIRDERPEFQFGRHLRECSEAWSRLSDDERNQYIEESRKLKENRKDLLASEPKADSRLTIPIDLFNPSRSVYGPCRPAHLYPKLPSAMSMWAEENDIKVNNRMKLWRNLPESVQEIYIQRRDKLKETTDKQKKEIDRKHKYVKSLLKEAVDLEHLKKEMHLVSASKRAVKNLYA